MLHMTSFSNRHGKVAHSSPCVLAIGSVVLYSSDSRPAPASASDQIGWAQLAVATSDLGRPTPAHAPIHAPAHTPTHLPDKRETRSRRIFTSQSAAAPS